MAPLAVKASPMHARLTWETPAAQVSEETLFSLHERNMHCKNYELYSSLLASLGDTGTCLPSQPSPDCCSQTLTGERSTPQQTPHTAKHETTKHSQLERKNTPRLHTDKKIRRRPLTRSAGKEVQTVLRPVVEDSARSPSSVLLKTSSRADFVGVLPHCLPHCHTTFNWSLPSLIVVFLSVRLFASLFFHKVLALRLVLG